MREMFLYIGLKFFEIDNVEFGINLLDNLDANVDTRLNVCENSHEDLLLLDRNWSVDEGATAALLTLKLTL